MTETKTSKLGWFILAVILFDFFSPSLSSFVLALFVGSIAFTFPFLLMLLLIVLFKDRETRADRDRFFFATLAGALCWLLYVHPFDAAKIAHGAGGWLPNALRSLRRMLPF